MSSSRNSKADKALQEKLQALLSHLLREEDNKYCADCDAKGPRWAAWNLGIFVCIRCAGIHRNLGVHISRVKSVNLDSWTDEQVGSVQNMGNSKGRAVYEANLPDGFRRPQYDSALETFIRAKYEQKKYIAREWLPPPGPPKADFSVLGIASSGSGKTAASLASRGSTLTDYRKGHHPPQQLDLSAAVRAVPRPALNSSTGSPFAQKSSPQQSQAIAPVTSANAASAGDDLFADFISAPLPVLNGTLATTGPAENLCTPNGKPADEPKSADTEEKDFFNQVSLGASFDNTINTRDGDKTAGKIDTASIMSLYAKTPLVQSPLMQSMGSGGPLISPQAAANNPFLMGGLVSPQTFSSRPSLTGSHITGVSHPSLGSRGVAPSFACSPLTSASNGTLPVFSGLPAHQLESCSKPFADGDASTTCINTSSSNMNLLNVQMTGLRVGAQLGSSPMSNHSSVPTKTIASVNQFKPAAQAASGGAVGETGSFWK